MAGQQSPRRRQNPRSSPTHSGLARRVPPLWTVGPRGSPLTPPPPQVLCRAVSFREGRNLPVLRFRTVASCAMFCSRSLLGTSDKRGLGASLGPHPAHSLAPSGLVQRGARRPKRGQKWKQMGNGDTEDKATHQEGGCREDTWKCQAGAPAGMQGEEDLGRERQSLNSRGRAWGRPRGRPQAGREKGRPHGKMTTGLQGPEGREASRKTSGEWGLAGSCCYRRPVFGPSQGRLWSSEGEFCETRDSFYAERG